MPKKKVRSVGTPPPQIKAWSHSRLRDYEICPHRAKLKHVTAKHVNDTNPAMERGSRIHKEGERWLKREVTKFPEAYNLFKDEMMVLRKIKSLDPEGQFAFTDEWKAADWFDTTGVTWGRVQVDAAGIIKEGPPKKKIIVYRLIDFKTGKMNEVHEKQLELYALAGFKSQGVDLVRAELWYLDTGDVVELEYEESEVDPIEAAWRARANRMLNDRVFKTNPGRHCDWCPFQKAKGHKDAEGKPLCRF